MVRAARRPLIVAGGGVHHARAEEALRAFVEATGMPVASTQAGKGSLLYDHPQAVGGIGAHRHGRRRRTRPHADLVIGVGTRYSDFTTASRTLFADPDVRFVNLNIATPDAAKLDGVALVADAREGLSALTTALRGWSVDHFPARRDRTAGRRVGRDGYGCVRARPRPAARAERGHRRRQRGQRTW